MIEDEEFRRQFRSESGEHLQRIEQGLLLLEREPRNTDAIEALLRDVHSLKGDARILGLDAVERLAHAGEEQLGPAFRGEKTLAESDVARFLRWLDALRALCEDAAGGTPAAVNMEAEIARMAGRDVPSLPGGGAEGGERAREASQRAGDDTLRVPAARLDALLVDAGEFVVTRSRLVHRLRELQELAATLDEWGAPAKRGLTRTALEIARVRADAAVLCDRMDEDLSRLSALTDQLAADTHRLRMQPFIVLFRQFTRNVRDLAESEGKAVELVIEGGETGADKQIIEQLKDALLHLVRNAVHHGVEVPAERERAGKPATARLLLRAERRDRGVLVEVADDGCGLDANRLRQRAVALGMLDAEAAAALDDAQAFALILRAGFSTEPEATAVAGLGVGMAVVRQKVEILKGRLEIDSQPGAGTAIRIWLPRSIISSHTLLVRLGDALFGIPTEFVATCFALQQAGVSTVGGRSALLLGGRPVTLVRLEQLLELPEGPAEAPGRGEFCVVLRVADETFALLVDEVVDEQELIVSPPGALLKRVRNLAGAAILGTGEVCSVLNAQDLAASVAIGEGAAPPPPRQAPRRPRILLVEDSLITRTQEARILKAAGYDVVTAVDGLDASRKLAEGGVDAVVTDVLMPNLDGLALTRNIRANPATSDLPVILVTTLASERDRRRGLEVGADAYIAKSLFEQEALLAALRRLVD